MELTIKIPYRVRDMFKIDLPEPLLDLEPRFYQSRVGPDVIYAEVESGEILMRPSIGLKSRIDRSWVYHDGSKICFDTTCKDLGRIFKAALISNNMAIVVGDGRSSIVELSEDGVRVRPVNVKEILESVHFIDKPIILIKEKGLRRRVSLVDQGFLYTVTSYCIERREGHAVVAFEADGYTRIYFGSEHGGYLIHDTSGSPAACSIGYRVATVWIRDRGSIYVGRNLYLEAPSRSVGIAWIPEDRVLLLYDHRNGWLLESDLRSFKPIARLSSRPLYLGRLGDTHVMMVDDGLVAVRGSLVFKPEIHLGGYRNVSVSSEGLVIDLGDRLVIRSLDGRDVWSIEKDREAICGGYGDKIVCIRGSMVGVVEPSEGSVVIRRSAGRVPGIVISSDGKISNISVGGDVDVIGIAGRNGDSEVVIAPKILGKTVRSYVELEDILSKHRAEIEVGVEPPTISIEHAVLVVSRTGLHVGCSSPGYAEAVIRFGGDGLHDLYRYVARVTSRGRVLGSAPFHVGSSGERIELKMCIEEASIDGEAWLEIAATRGDLDGEAFYRAPLEVVVLDLRVDVSLNHYSDKSELLAMVKGPSGAVENMRVSVKCMNTSFERVEKEGGAVSITVGGCEAPARITVTVEDRGFIWIISREIPLQDLEWCVKRYSEMVGLSSIMCSQGGFYRHVPPLTYRDLSPVREARILNVPGRGTQVLISTDRHIAYSIAILGEGYVVRQGYLSPGASLIDLGLAAELKPLRLSIFGGDAYREYLLEPEDLAEMLVTALRTSYKLSELLGELGL